jgi:hypothetical protein
MAENQSTRGMGSGNVAQARLDRDMGTTEALTELRRAQIASDANLGVQRVEAGKTAAESVADVTAENERNRAQAMYAEALTQKPKAPSSGGRGSGGGSGTSRSGSRSSGTYDPAVAARQQELSDMGYDVTVDGIDGPQTQAANAQQSENARVVENDILEAKANGHYGQPIQSMINSAYQEGYITKEQKKDLENKYRSGIVKS